LGRLTEDWCCSKAASDFLPQLETELFWSQLETEMHSRSLKTESKN